ncbi:MAG: hypothetical protein WAP37_04895 [Solirubrobacterales bacterium]
MQLMFWIWLGVVLKLPVAGICWYIWRIVHDETEQVIGDVEGGDGGVPYAAGPRSRGPHDGSRDRPRAPRRGDLGHEKAPREPVPETALRGE